MRRRLLFKDQKKAKTILLRQEKATYPEDTGLIICTSYKNGKCHDYRLFKESGIKIQSQVKIAVDTGYQGLQIHLQTLLPQKRVRKTLYQSKIRKIIQL